MADEPPNTSDVSDPVGPDSPKEDAETEATREELKQTVISEKAERNPTSIDVDETTSTDRLAADKGTSQKKTPELDAPPVTYDALKEQVSSPKKKRAHDEVDEQKEAEDGDTAADSQSNGSAAADRADRTEPLKKRPRDKELDEAIQSSKDAPVRFLPALSGFKATSPTRDLQEPSAADESAKKSEFSSDKAPAKSSDTAPKVAAASTSSSAFASSGFAKLSASNASPFGALGGASTPNIFASSSGSQSPFGAVAAAKPPAPTLSFGGGGGRDGSGSASPFANLNNGPASTFGGGSAFGSGFGSGFAGARLTSFAKPGEVLKKSDKPARPFGAPASDDEEDLKSPASDDEDDTEGGEEGEVEEKDNEREKTEEPKSGVDDKKKPKLQRIIVDDGEAGEATIYVARARLYYQDKVAGWKERGAGNLKINVPERCVAYDDDGNAIAASFDASTLQDDDEEEVDLTKTKVARLIIRQDSTHRVILNTALLPSTEFQMKQTLKSTTIIFTAFEGDDAKPVNVQMKMSTNNVNSFMTLTTGIQKELRGD